MKKQNSSIHDAVENNDFAKLKAVLAAGEDINTCGKYERTALHLAAKSGNTQIAEYLLSNGADINFKNAHGFTPVYVAAIANNVEVLEVLVNIPTTDVDATDAGGMSALIAASCNGCKDEIIACLVSVGASVSLRDSIGRCALDWAREKGFSSIASILLRQKQQQTANQSDLYS